MAQAQNTSEQLLTHRNYLVRRDPSSPKETGRRTRCSFHVNTTLRPVTRNPTGNHCGSGPVDVGGSRSTSGDTGSRGLGTRVPFGDGDNQLWMDDEPIGTERGGQKFTRVKPGRGLWTWIESTEDLTDTKKNRRF